MFDFRAPFFLLLLAAVPVLIIVQRRAHLSTAKWRRRVTVCLRGIALFCAILALADLHRTRTAQRLAVLFLIDTSESVDTTQAGEQTTEARAVFERITAAVSELEPSDSFGITTFARGSGVLLEMRQKQEHLAGAAATGTVEGGIASVLSESALEAQMFRRDGTDLIAALIGALAVLPENLSLIHI